MAGIPPLMGFFAKQFVLYSAIQSGYYFMAIVGIIVSVISASYYLKIIKIIHSIEPDLSDASGSSNFTTSAERRELENSSQSILASEAKTNSVSSINKFSIYSNSIYSNSPISSIHSFLIGILTLIILLFIFNPDILLNSIAIFISIFLNL